MSLNKNSSTEELDKKRLNAHYKSRIKYIFSKFNLIGINIDFIYNKFLELDIEGDIICDSHFSIGGARFGNIKTKQADFLMKVYDFGKKEQEKIKENVIKADKKAKKAESNIFSDLKVYLNKNRKIYLGGLTLATVALAVSAILSSGKISTTLDEQDIFPEERAAITKEIKTVTNTVSIKVMDIIGDKQEISSELNQEEFQKIEDNSIFNKEEVTIENKKEFSSKDREILLNKKFNSIKKEINNIRERLLEREKEMNHVIVQLNYIKAKLDSIKAKEEAKKAITKNSKATLDYLEIKIGDLCLYEETRNEGVKVKIVGLNGDNILLKFNGYSKIYPVNHEYFKARFIDKI